MDDDLLSSSSINFTMDVNTKNTFIGFYEVSKYWKTIFLRKNRPAKGLKIDVKMRENLLKNTTND